MAGEMCDAAKSTAVAASKSAGEKCGKNASSNDCAVAIQNSRQAAGAAFDICLIEGLIDDMTTINQKTDRFNEGVKGTERTKLAKA